MKNEIIKHSLLNIDNSTKNKSNNSLTKISYTFRNKQNRLSLLLNAKAFKKPRKSVISRGSIKSNIKLNKKIMFEKNLKDNIIYNQKEKIIDINQFYYIRKKIYKNLKKPYISPYLENSLFQTKYSKDPKNPPSIVEKIKIYDYFQICYLINKEIKNYRLLSKFNDSTIFSDIHEYLINYFNGNEYNIIMNYLLYQIYSKDEFVISKNLSKKKILDESIIKSFNKLTENNYIYKKNIEIQEGDQNYSRNEKNNPKRKKEYFESINLKPLLKPNIDYIYIKDIPKYLVPNCLPNLFPNLTILSLNFKIYINFRKNNIILPKKTELLKETKQKDYITENKPKNSYFKYKYLNDNNFKENKEHIYDNRSSEEDIKDEIQNLKFKIIDDKKNILDEDVKDIENFLFRINGSWTKNKGNKEKNLFLKNEKLKHNHLKKLDLIKNKKEENKSKINEDIDNSLLENKKNIILYNKKYFIKIAKKSMFKTSLNGTISFSKTNKNSQNSKYYNPNSSINDGIQKINTRNKNDKSKIRNILKSINLKLKNKKNSIIKSKTLSGKSTTKNLYNTYREMFNNENSKIFEKIYNINACKNNLSSKYFKKVMSQSTIHRIHNRHFENSLVKTINEFRNNKIIGLYEFEKIYKETKEKGLLPKAKINYNSVFHKAFESFGGFNFLKYIENKGYNKNEEMEENKSLNDYSSDKLKKIIKQFQNKSKLFNKNNFSLKTLIKSPNLYSQ